MKLIRRLTAIVVVVALSLAYSPRSGHAASASTSTAKNCVFVRNDLPCPCPRAQQARTLARAARVTAKALGTAIVTTVSALARADGNHDAAGVRRDASEPTQPAKR